MAGLAAVAAAGAAAFGVRGPVFVKEFLRVSEAAGVLRTNVLILVTCALDE